MASTKVATATAKKDNQSAFDKLPIAVQMIAGVGALALVAVVGVAVFLAVDLLLLDLDPVGKLISGIAHAMGH